MFVYYLLLKHTKFKLEGCAVQYSTTSTWNLTRQSPDLTNFCRPPHTLKHELVALDPTFSTLDTNS